MATLENNKFPTRKGYFLIVLINTEVYYSIIAHYRKHRNPFDTNLFLNRLKLLKPPQSDLESTNLLRNKETIWHLVKWYLHFLLIMIMLHIMTNEGFYFPNTKSQLSILNRQVCYIYLFVSWMLSRLLWAIKLATVVKIKWHFWWSIGKMLIKLCEKITKSWGNW